MNTPLHTAARKLLLTGLLSSLGTFRRTNTSRAPYDILAEGAKRIEFQAQRNY